jgi:hypothetical protein
MEVIDITTLTQKLTPFLTFAVIILYIFKDTINDKIKDWRRVKKIIDLTSHDVFLTTENVRTIIKRIEFTTKGKPDVMKTKVLHHLIDLKIDTVNKKFNELLNDSNIDSCSGQSLKFKVITCLTNIVKEYNDQAFKDFVSWGISESDAKFAIDAYEDFRKDIVDAFLERLESISTNDDYNTNYDKMSSILEVVAISLYLIPKDAKNAFDLINGKFSKYGKNN